jgi:hypothetical protein
MSELNQEKYRLERLFTKVDQNVLWDDDGKELVYSYIKSGDIDKFISLGSVLFDVTNEDILFKCRDTGVFNDVLSLHTVLFYGADLNLDSFIARSIRYINWVFERPMERGLSFYQFQSQDIFEMRWMQNHPRLHLFDHAFCFTQDEWNKTFDWIFGSEFNFQRVLPYENLNSPIKKGFFRKRIWKPRLYETRSDSLNIAKGELFTAFRHYLFRSEDSYDDYNFSYYESIIDYVLPLLKGLGSEVFPHKYVDRDHLDKKGNKTGLRALQNIDFTFANIVAYKEGINFLDSEKIVIRNKEAFEKVCAYIDNIDFPYEFYQQMESVKAHRENYFYVKMD